MLNAHHRLYQWQTDKESTVISINGPLSLNGIKASWTSFIWVPEFCPKLKYSPLFKYKYSPIQPNSELISHSLVTYTVGWAAMTMRYGHKERVLIHKQHKAHSCLSACI